MRSRLGLGEQRFHNCQCLKKKSEVIFGRLRSWSLTPQRKHRTHPSSSPSMGQPKANVKSAFINPGWGREDPSLGEVISPAPPSPHPQQRLVPEHSTEGPRGVLTTALLPKTPQAWAAARQWHPNPSEPLPPTPTHPFPPPPPPCSSALASPSISSSFPSASPRRGRGVPGAGTHRPGRHAGRAAAHPVPSGPSTATLGGLSGGRGWG